MEYRELNENRRSANFFDHNVSITLEEIEAIYEQAKLVPSSFNFQRLKIVLVLSREISEKLREAANDQPKVTEASAVLVLFRNTRQYLESEEIFADRIDTGYMKKEDLPMYLEMAKSLYQRKEIGFVSRNAGIFAMNFMLAALDNG